MQIYLLFAAFLHRVNTHNSNSPLISLHLRQSRLRISIEQDIMFTASTNQVPTEAYRFKSGQPLESTVQHEIGEQIQLRSPLLPQSCLRIKIDFAIFSHN